MTCYRHPSRPAAIVYLGVPMCEPCWGAECRRQDKQEEREYCRRVMRVREQLCSGDEQLGAAPAETPASAHASQGSSSGHGGRTDPAEPGTAAASSDKADTLSHSPTTDASARPGLADPSEGGPGQFSLWDTD